MQMARIKHTVLRIVPTDSTDHKEFKPRSVFDVDFPEEMTPEEKKLFKDEISRDDLLYIVGYPYPNRQPEDADNEMARIKLTVLRIVHTDSTDHKEFKPRSVFDIDFPEEMTPEEKRLFKDEISQNDLLYIVGYPYPIRVRPPRRGKYCSSRAGGKYCGPLGGRKYSCLENSRFCNGFNIGLGFLSCVTHTAVKEMV